MKLKIISDGTIYGSRVLNAETGEEVERVRSVTWYHEANKMPYAIITLMDTDVQVVVDDMVNLGDANAH